MNATYDDRLEGKRLAENDLRQRQLTQSFCAVNAFLDTVQLRIYAGEVKRWKGE